MRVIRIITPKQLNTHFNVKLIQHNIKYNINHRVYCTLPNNFIVTEEPPPLQPKVTPETIFNHVWEKLEAIHGLEKLRFPKEIIFLMGAPGSGKGTNTPFISRERGITAKPIVISDLLSTPEMQSIKASSGLVSDEDVITLLFNKLLGPIYEKGVIVDGFPRTPTQVEIVVLLKEKMDKLYKQSKSSLVPNKKSFVRPVFRVTVLYISEQESVSRQLARGKLAKMKYEESKRSGIGSSLEIRPTDFDPSSAASRYNIFQKHYDTLLTLQKHFTFNIINATGTVKEVEKAIIKEFKYQSNMELGPETYDLISALPTVEEMTQHSRQDMIARLDNYAEWHLHLFTSVLNNLKKEFYPLIERNLLGGYCIVKTKYHIYFDNSLSIKMALDILAERGFIAVVEEVIIDSHPTFIFKITWNPPLLRRQ